MKHYLKLTTLLLLLALFVIPENLLACTCDDYGVPICKHYADADAVFIGIVEKLTAADGAYDTGTVVSGINSETSAQGIDSAFVHFKIEKSFKGIETTSIKARTDRGTSCSIDITQGSKWIVFAYKDATGSYSFGFPCGGSDPVGDDDSAYVKEIEEISHTENKPSISGHIVQRLSDNVSGAKVFLEGNGVKLMTETDANGIYKFDVPQIGKYKVKVILPFTAPGEEGVYLGKVKESLTESQTILEYEAETKSAICNYQLFRVRQKDLKATAIVKGRFLSNTFPLPSYINTEFCPLKSTEMDTLQGCKIYADYDSPQNTYTFSELREGKYIIVINRNNIPEYNSPYLRLYYPGVTRFSDAKIINLKQGQQLNLLDFKLPSPVSMQKVTGRVFLPDGSPANIFDASSFSLYDLSGRYISNPDIFEINSDGYFAFPVFKNYTYILGIRIYGANRKPLYAYAKIKPDNNLQPISINMKEGNKHVEEFLHPIDDLFK